MADIELNDIQGILARGYGNLRAARFVLTQIVDPAKARAWLAGLLDQDQITPGSQKPERFAMNIAFTATGLEALGLDGEIRAGFSEDFLAGMTTPHKRLILGDHGSSTPENWNWGGPDNEPVHLLLLMYSIDEDALNEKQNSLVSGLESKGLSVVNTLGSKLLAGVKEHFGFKDGIAQPFLHELQPSGDKNKAVALGEFLLGYPNAYKLFTQRPLLDSDRDPKQHLPMDVENSGKRDLGKNGTYLVFRQMEQHVERFWSFMMEHANQDNAHEDGIRLASKMVGRWPSGAPLVKAPDKDIPEMENLDNFGYHREDQRGLKCPFGSHIRRTNPRDSLDPEPGTQKSMDFTNRHRILRRGRSYGEPLAHSMEVADILSSLEAEDKGDRGLNFICLNANIARQFEFVQHTWSNNPNFSGLYDDPDPLTGDRGGDEKKRDIFTVQSTPVRKQVCGMPDFVTVRGGAYFFLPGIRALRFLADIE